MKKQIFVLLALLNITLFSCKAPQTPIRHQSEISYAAFKEKKDSDETFFLFLYAPWCDHCKVSIPLVEELFKERNDYYLMNGEELSKEEHLEFKAELLTKTPADDSLYISDGSRAFYPTIAYYEKGDLAKMKSGLPKTKKNLEILIQSFTSSDT